MKQMYRLMLGLLVTVLMGSCIKEDYDDCDNVSITFEYLADGDRNVLSQFIDKIDLYVFEAGGPLVDVYQYASNEIGGEIEFKLPAGTYEVVAVGNAFERTAVTDVTGTDLNNIFITHPAWGSGGIMTGHDDNYLGTKVINVPSEEGRKSHDVVRLYSAHIDVEIEIHGLTAAQADGIRLVIDQANAVTSFRNEVDDAQKGTYYPELSYDEVNNCYRTQDLALFRLDNGGTLDPDLCQHVIRVEDGEGNTLTEVNLYEFLQSVDSDKLDVTRQEALLPISITFYLFTVEVELPVWYVEDVVPGWN